MDIRRPKISLFYFLMASYGSEERQVGEGRSYDDLIVRALRSLSPIQQQVIETLWKSRGEAELHVRVREKFGSDVFDPVWEMIERLQRDLHWNYLFVLSNLKLYLPAVIHPPS